MSTANTPSGIEWRYTAKRVRLGSFDASAVVPPLILFAMKIKMWTFMLLIVTVIVMWILEVFFRLPFGEALRSLRRIVAGNRRNAVPWWEQRKL
jgi:hypothetical protein